MSWEKDTCQKLEMSCLLQWELRPYSSDGADLDLILRAAQPAVSVLVGCFVVKADKHLDRVN